MKKILIIRLSSIGDIVLTSPVIRCIKQQSMNTAVHFVTKKNFLPTVSENPYIDKIHLLDKSLNELIKELKKENFDFVIDLHKNLRSRAILLKLGKPFSSFNKLNSKKWLMVNFKINFLPEKHIVDRYFDSLKKINIKNDEKGLDYFVSQEDQKAPLKLPVIFHAGYYAFIIGGQHATKRLPNEKIIAICQQIEKPLLLLGGKEDFKNAETIVLNCPQSIIYNACGKFRLNESAGLVLHAEKIISHDTGLMHIAAAYKKDILSIWGNTIPEFGMYPYLSGKNSKIVEVKNLSCRPCSKIGFEKCPKQHFNCMNQINENEVLDWINNPFELNPQNK